MSIDVRVGDYHLDSSNFVSEDGFQGFLGTTGEVGIDRDYNSLRQDLWLSTDQAYKQAVTQMSLKQSFLRSLTKPPEIDDFSQTTPIVKIDPRVEPDWTTRNWEEESRQASAALLKFPQLNATRVNYYLVYFTYYLMNTEGTTIRTSHHLAAIEAAIDTTAGDGMSLHNFYAIYVAKPGDLPDRFGFHRPGAVSRRRFRRPPRAGARSFVVRSPSASFHHARLRRNDAAHGRPQRMVRSGRQPRAARDHVAHR
jgi:hypothetical protein